MALAPNKTKLVCTIGPASESPETLLQMLHAGMNIARLNFSHGDFSWHKTAIDRLRLAARTAGKLVTIMADLPGPKMRIGPLAQEPIELKRGDAFTLTTNEMMVDHYRPTRAEATDVANAILDGTDCVMLSEESAMGKFPVEAVNMLARIASATEPYRTDVRVRESFADYDHEGDMHLVDLISRNVHKTMETEEKEIKPWCRKASRSIDAGERTQTRLGLKNNP